MAERESHEIGDLEDGGFGPTMTAVPEIAWKHARV